MNINRNNNNRRRGRGNNNNNNRGGGGGQGGQGNRIDSRARGNAPQMLEKYRKLAHDASLNDDRVLTEYYLQFADHYFRVIADMKAPKDEQQRVRREFERGQDEDEFDNEGEEDSRGRNFRSPQRNNSSDYEDISEGVEGEPDEGNPFSPDARQEPRRAPREQRSDGRSEPRREPRVQAQAEPRAESRDEPRAEARSEARPESRPEPRSAPRAERAAPKPRKPARRREQDEDDDGPVSFDPGVLPPAIARSEEPAPSAPEADDAAPPARKSLRVRTTRKPRSAEGGEEALEAVG